MPKAPINTNCWARTRVPSDRAYSASTRLPRWLLCEHVAHNYLGMHR